MFVVDRFILLLTGGLDCCQLVYLMTMIANPVVMISPREKRERIQFMGTLKLFVKETLSYIFKIYFDCRLPSSVFFGSLWQSLSGFMMLAQDRMNLEYIAER